MKVFRIVLDVNHYQSLLVEDDSIWRTNELVFDASPKQNGWKPPGVYVLHPLLKRGNFFHFCAGAFACDRTALGATQDLLERSAELLPIGHKGERLYVVNVTECIAVLDEERTRWIYGETTGMPIRIDRYCFHPRRLTETPLFKIPETARGEIFTVEGMKDPEDEFKYRVEQAGLQGLVFEEVWSE